MAQLKIEQPQVAAFIEWAKKLDRKTLIQNGIICITFFSFIFFFFLPVHSKRNGLKGENLQLANQVRQASGKISQIPRLKEQKDMYGTRIEKMRKKFFEPEEKDQMIEVISTIATELSVQIIASRPSDQEFEMPAEYGQMYGTISYDLTVEATYHNLGTFINELEVFERHFGVYHLIVSKSRANPLLVQAQLTLVAFFKERIPEEIIMQGMPF
jgi:Tfp pilus assembly protein PilO